MPEVVKKYRIEKLHVPIDGVYHYNVQELTSVDGGKTFWYCGFGKFCRTLEEANIAAHNMKEDWENGKRV